MKTLMRTLGAAAILLSLAPLVHADNNKDVTDQEQSSDVNKAIRSAELALQPGPSQPQPPPPYGQPQTYVAPLPAEQVDEGDQGILNDAGASGMWLSPTALMAPEGTWSFEDNELFILGGSYSFTDNFAVSMHTLVPLGQDFFPFTLSAKYGLVDEGSLRLAVTGTVFGLAGVDDAGYSGGVGGVASLCLDTQCHSFLNGYVGALTVFSETSTTSVPIMFSGGITQRITDRVKLIVEVDGGAVIGDYDAIGDGFLAWYGVRFLGGQVLAVNVGFVKPIIEDESGGLPLGLPWVSLVYRGLPGQ